MRTTNTIDNIEIDQIAISESRRSVDPATVSSIAKSLDNTDLLNPIQVRRGGDAYVLIAGRHRIEAFKQLGRERIPAITLKVNDFAASRAEIEENLCRKELSQAERTKAVKNLNTLLEKERPIAVWGGERWSDADLDEKVPQGDFSGEAEPRGKRKAGLAKELMNEGMGRSAAFREAKIAENVPSDVIDFLEHSPADNNRRTAEALSRLPHDDQRKAVAAVRSGTAETILKAIKASKSAPPASGNGSEPATETDQESAAGNALENPDSALAGLSDDSYGDETDEPDADSHNDSESETGSPAGSDDETMLAIEEMARNQFEGRLEVAAARLETLADNLRREL